MSMNVQPRGARFQLRVVHKLLLKSFFFTFDSEEQARSYGNQFDGASVAAIVVSGKPHFFGGKLG